jgi:prophage regulatory protein
MDAEFRTAFSPSSQSRLLRLPEVIELTALSRSSIYAAVSRGTFPAPFRLGARAVGWRHCDIEHWLAERPCARSAPTDAQQAVEHGRLRVVL